jgi:hypothetical protein
MPDIEKKEPGRPDVQQHERGDPRQHDQPIDRHRPEPPKKPAQDEPPASRGHNSPWMGGG